MSKSAKDIRFEVFRAIKNSSEYASCFSGPLETPLETGDTTGLYNFPLSDNADKLDITVYWKENGRDFKETFHIDKHN